MLTLVKKKPTLAKKKKKTNIALDCIDYFLGDLKKKKNQSQYKTEIGE